MKKYNDYENIMYDYLKNYNQFKARLKNIQIEINSIMEQINSLNDVKISKYSSQPKASLNVFSSVEQSYERKQKLIQKMQMLQADKSAINELLLRIDNALETLSFTDRAIIEKKFIYGYNWSAVAIDINFSERTCQRIAINAIKRLTQTLFGEVVYEQGRLFIFVDKQYKYCG